MRDEERKVIVLAVRDIMQTAVVTVTTHTTARELARLLSDEEISGAPVLDRKGHLAGVVSATDLVRLAAEDSCVQLTTSVLRTEVERIRDPEADAVGAHPYGLLLPEYWLMDWRRFLDQLPESDFDTVLVREITTPAPFSVEPEMPLCELCEFLVRGRIHRAVVLEKGRLLGIVTSVDVLRAVAEHGVEA